MYSFSRRSLLLALVAATALLAPSDVTVSAMSSTTSATGTSDEPDDSGLECNDDDLGDGACDSRNNIEACSYDRGDCCECTCSPKDFNCGGSYDCVNPDAECFGDDDGNGGVQTTMDLDDDTEGDGTSATAAEDDDASVTTTEAGDDDTSTADGATVDTLDESAAGTTPFSSVSAGIAAAAGAAAVFAGCAL